MREISMTSAIRSPSGCMWAMVMAPVRRIKSPTYRPAEIFRPRCCAESGGGTQTELPNRNNRAILWEELRAGGM